MIDGKFVFEQFDSLSEYINIIGERSVNRVFSYRYIINDIGSEKENYSFSLTNSYVESVGLALNGYKEGCEGLKSSVKRIQHCENVTRFMPTTDITGFAPHVPNAITGVPKSMISHMPVQKKAKVLTLVFNNENTAATNANQFIKAGKNVVDLINALEEQGYRVALYSLVVSCGNQIAAALVKIKDWKQPTNILKIAYPLIHPAFSRRQFFKWLETCPQVTDDELAIAYGKPLYKLESNYDKQITLLRQMKVLTNNWFYLDNNLAKDNGVDSLISLLGIDARRKAV